MARVALDNERFIDRPSRHAPAKATYSIIEVDGETLLQIDTYGSDQRAMPDKVSQSLQFDAAARRQLRDLLDRLG